ncbi:hypothetical protein [Azospirillum sp. ST 5-10]|uniref:hypothetical protein n=1 Tax=unclassified Azospirillum TaxID=2630922 RepID=UPI003F4A6837
MTAHIARFAAPLLLWLAAVLVITEFLGWLFAWPVAFGGLRVGSAALYWPGQFLGWRGIVAPGHRWTVDTAAGLSLLLAAVPVWRLWRVRSAHSMARFGAARWAGRADVRRSGLQ